MSAINKTIINPETLDTVNHLCHDIKNSIAERRQPQQSTLSQGCSDEKLEVLINLIENSYNPVIEAVIRQSGPGIIA